MQHAQIIAFGLEGRLVDVLRELAQANALWLREVRHIKTCVNLLRQGGAKLLVLRLGNHIDQELALLDKVSRLFPLVRTLVVGPVENTTLEALAWDLGVAYALFPPQPIETLRELVQGFLPKVADNRVRLE
jgi:hypothetical protein